MDPLLLALVEAGVLSMADADRIDRQLDPDKARQYAESLLTDAYRRGLTQQQRRILDLTDATEGNPTQRQLHDFWAQEDELLFTSVADDLRSVAIERAVVASISAPNPDTWRLVNESVLAWVDDYYVNPDAAAVGSIPNLNVTARTRFAQAFRDWQRGELETAGYNEGLPALIEALEPAFGANRAQRIGVTEVSRVFAESERAAANANPFVTSLVWETGRDERVCPICGPRQGLVVGKESDGFRVTTDNITGFPPAHVNCRCSISSLTQPALEALRAEGFVNG